MKREKGELVQEAICPQGFSFINYEPGDEIEWAKIEASVGEFDDVSEALSYFNIHYISSVEDLKKRCIFIQNDQNEKVATFTIWWDNEVPCVNWVGVKPTYQGIGLGKAIVYKGIETSVNLLGDVSIYLHTQTWSYKAIGIYQQAGFKILEVGTFGSYQNDYEKAIEILKGYIR